MKNYNNPAHANLTDQPFTKKADFENSIMKITPKIQFNYTIMRKIVTLVQSSK